MGLGLSIVKNVVEELYGTIEIVSVPVISQGTEVRIILNQCLSGNETPLTSEPDGINQVVIKNTVNDKIINVELVTIMIIEDNLDMLSYLLTKISARNYNVLVAVNGSEAIQKLKANTLMPDLFICDVMMDTMDGYQFREIISKDSKYNHIPFMFLTAKSDKFDKTKGLKLGAIDFIMKPFSLNELMQKIESIVNLAGKKKELFLNSILKSSVETKPSSEERFNFNCIQFGLTQREVEIVKYIEDGCSYKEISTNLFISDRTVEKHVQHIFKKVEVGSKVELLKKLNY
jgi:DNA-binding NarL/FixJ family response regulator